MTDNNFNFTISFDDATEKLYEYYISQCISVFDTPNENVEFYISDDKNEKWFFMMAYHDNCPKTDIDSVQIEELPFTCDKYNTILFNDIDPDAVEIENGHIIISNNEIRYIKLNFAELKNELCRLFYKTANRCLKIKEHNGKMIFDEEKLTFYYSGYYVSKNSFCRKRDDLDITDLINNCYL